MGPRVRAAPSPYDLFDAPELASVDALAAVLEITVAAVVAANPELLDAELLDGRGPPSAQVWMADAIVSHAHAHALGTALERYRVAVELARNSPKLRNTRRSGALPSPVVACDGGEPLQRGSSASSASTTRTDSSPTAVGGGRAKASGPRADRPGQESVLRQLPEPGRRGPRATAPRGGRTAAHRPLAWMLGSRRGRPRADGPQVVPPLRPRPDGRR